MASSSATASGSTSASIPRLSAPPSVRPACSAARGTGHRQRPKCPPGRDAPRAGLGTGGLLQRLPPGGSGGSAWQELQTDVTSIASAGNGDVIALDSGGNLYNETRLNGASQLIGTSVVSFAIADNGNVIALNTLDNLYDQQGSGGIGTLGSSAPVSNPLQSRAAVKGA